MGHRAMMFCVHIVVICGIFTTSAISSQASDVFLDAEEANTFLQRSRRSNSLFEEIQPGNQERECVEESCSYEEAFEISDNSAIAQKFWSKYKACKTEVIPVGRRRRRRQSTNQQKTQMRRCLADPNDCQPEPCTKTNTVLCQDLFQSFQCVCRPGFEGNLCESAVDYCKSNDCAKTGTDRCESAAGTYRCVCKPGFTGNLCQTSLDHCLRRPCDARGTQSCINSPASFQCICNDGYTGTTCETDIDNCVGSPCLNGGICLDGLNGFVCVCDELHFGFTCDKEIDDCRNHGCSDHGTCLPSPDGRSYSCQCGEGFQGPNCDEDVDECSVATPCEQECKNTIGSYRCSCEAGYLVNIPDLHSCKDIDECSGSPGCDFKCVNSVGSYECICDIGYAVDKLFGRYCEDVDECRTNNGGCAGKCVNGLGSYICTCFNGYESQDGGRACTDIDECNRNHGCEYTCINHPGSYECTCPDGYKLNYDKKTCRDINECSLPTPPCDQKCRNAPGTYTCSCNRGYTLNEETSHCDDINECSVELKKCSDICINTEGSFRCECETGYELVGTRCFNINDCKSSPCVHGRCFDAVNSFSCTCSFGWAGDLCDVTSDACSDAPCVHGECEVSGVSYTCTCDAGYTGWNCDEDINECESNTATCSGQCQNTPGSYTCLCGEGFTGTGETCVDVNECEDTNICENECVNTQGSFMCMCSPGFTGNLPNCIDVDECLTQTSSCTQDCVNSIGSYECACTEGYVLNGTDSCTDIDECTLGESPCSEVCVNTPGSYKCTCPPGHRLNDDGVTCMAIAGCQGNPNVTYTGTDHLVLGIKSQDYVSKKLRSALKNKFYFVARFRTTAQVGIVMGIADQSGESSAYIMISMGNIRAGITCGGDYTELVPNPDVYVADGAWHVVKLRATKSSAKLIVDKNTKSRGAISGSSFYSKGTLLHIGGVPSNHTFAMQLGSDLYFKGCFASVQTKPKMLWTPSKRSVYNSHIGCVANLATDGVYFYGTGYAKFDAGQYREFLDFKLRVKVRTSVGDGLIVSGSTRNRGTYYVKLENGQVVAEVKSRTGAILQSAVYENQEKMLCDGLWMTIDCRVSGGKINLYVDGKSALKVKRGPRVLFNTRTSLFVGGLKGGALPHFKGSMKRLRINDVALDIRDSNDYDGVNMMGIPPR